MKKFWKEHEEGFNVTKDREGSFKRILLLSYLLIWVGTVLVFWCFTGPSDGMGYSLVYLWGVLPLSTLIISFLMGKREGWRSSGLLTALAFGVMYMLAEYATFGMANNMAFHKVNPPQLPMIAVGAVISAAGLWMGHLTRRRQINKKSNR